MIDHEKVSLLIHDLIITEVWKDKILPLVIEDLAPTHYVKLYLINYHESVVLGLLEKAFYHSSAVSAGGELLLELADYCYRKVVLLNHQNAGRCVCKYMHTYLYTLLSQSCAFESSECRELYIHICVFVQYICI
jgi:hypothetical protein